MKRVLISLASNDGQEKNLSKAREALAQVLISPVYTPAIWTEPYTSHPSPHTSHPSPHTPHLSPHTSHPSPHTSHLSPHTSHLSPHTSHPSPHTSHLSPHTSHPSPLTSHLYLNQLVSAQTDLDSNELNDRLKEIEKAQGRDDEARRQGIVPVDLDLLQHDGCRFHQRDWQRPYIQQLLPLIPE
ncbi:MAG: 2-amino-4-hydroxy-6-hydroxymethyldihydropteridine diphosphokinase [Prevotella sp.]|nr:2-amino-4-hydroxy-6-hydroxymethyldihydropteridine diphosphokinase [Prevotella sp.]